MESCCIVALLLLKTVRMLERAFFWNESLLLLVIVVDTCYMDGACPPLNTVCQSMTRTCPTRCGSDADKIGTRRNT
eukprot:3605318-Amphidinium_carterae.1